jgi:hypothetical protein
MTRKAPTMAPAPEWLSALVARRQRRLRLAEWRIEVEVSPTPNGSATTRACTVVTATRNYALLTFRDDLAKDVPDIVQTVDHELGHVAHGRIDQYVRDVLIAALPTKAARDQAYATYAAVMLEPFIDRLADVTATMEADDEDTDP